jgi:hypothetical protein
MIISSTTSSRGVQSYAQKRRAGRARLDLRQIASAARASALSVCGQLLPGGKREGNEYVVRNPKRADTRPGSFKIAVSGRRAGCWCDFATGDKGGDLISLVAYLHDLRQGEAARRLAAMLHLDPQVRS